MAIVEVTLTNLSALSRTPDKVRFFPGEKNQRTVNDLEISTAGVGKVSTQISIAEPRVHVIPVNYHGSPKTVTAPTNLLKLFSTPDEPGKAVIKTDRGPIEVGLKYLK